MKLILSVVLALLVSRNASKRNKPKIFTLTLSLLCMLKLDFKYRSANTPDIGDEEKDQKVIDSAEVNGN